MSTSLRQVKTVIVVCGLILLANLPGWWQVVANAPLRADTDTAAMLDAMRETNGLHGWWQWFRGDWFLHNGFYRPTTCLSLLIDYTLYGETGWGYRLTNWLLAVLTSLGFHALLRWFARRWLSPILVGEWQRQLFAIMGAAALSLQQTNALGALQAISAWWLVAWCVLAAVLRYAGEWRHNLRRHWWRILLGAGAFFWGWDRAVHSDFERLIVWVPSRTALLSTCLAVWSIWWLILWGDTGRLRFLLATSLFYAGAIGAYEQPLSMVPLVAVLALALRRQWQWRAWVAFAAVVALATGYLTLRFALLPASLSDYQQQQLRSAPILGMLQFLQTLLPVLNHVRYWVNAGPNPYLFFFKDAWDTLVADLAFVGVLVAFWRLRAWFGWWLLWQGITYLPMSLLHPFEHYYYLPQVGQNAVDFTLVAWGAQHISRLLHGSRKAQPATFERC